VSHFFLALVQSGYPAVDDALASLEPVKLLPVLFDLFFQYDWHNLFHSAAERIFNGVLLSKHVGLLSSLFIDGRFLQKSYAALEHAQTVEGKRAGNLGHILRILNAFSSWDDQHLVMTVIGPAEATQWVEFRDGLLNEENWRASPVDELPSDPPPPTPDNMYGVPPPESYIAGLSLNHDFGDSDDEPEGDPPRPASALDYRQGYGDAIGFDSDDEDDDESVDQVALSGSNSEGIPCLGCGRMWETNENFCASCGRKRTPEERVQQESSRNEVEQSHQETEASLSEQSHQETPAVLIPEQPQETPAALIPERHQETPAILIPGPSQEVASLSEQGSQSISSPEPGAQLTVAADEQATIVSSQELASQTPVQAEAPSNPSEKVILSPSSAEELSASGPRVIDIL
jgi:hypothetical protein